MSHSPGPWDYEEDHDSSCGWPCTEDGCPEDHPSGTYRVIGPEERERGEYTNEEDARLMAAAPELLEALRAVLEAPLDGGINTSDAIGDARRLLDRLSGPVAKGVA